MRRLLIIVGTALLVCSHVACYQFGAWMHRPARAVAERALGSASPFVDVAALALDTAANSVQQVFLSGAAEQVAQCRVAVRDASALLAGCNKKLGDLLRVRERAQRQTNDAERLMVVRFEREGVALDACRAWAQTPVCPELLR